MAKAWFEAVNISCTREAHRRRQALAAILGSQVTAVQPPSRNMS